MNIFTKTAVRFRLTLLISLILAIIVVVGVVIYGVGLLNSYATTVNEQVRTTATSTERESTMRAQITQLEEYRPAAERAKQIVADSQQYQYQNTIIQDISRFANRAGVQIESYDFTAAADAATSPAPAQPPASVDPTSPTPAAPAAGNLRSTFVNVTLKSPVDYRNFITFLHYLEQNLTKMQIANLSLSKDGETSGVVPNSLRIEVYVR